MSREFNPQTTGLGGEAFWDKFRLGKLCYHEWINVIIKGLDKESLAFFVFLPLVMLGHYFSPPKDVAFKEASWSREQSLPDTSTLIFNFLAPMIVRNKYL